MNTDTPEIDHATQRFNSGEIEGEYVEAGIAREMERERNRARSEAEYWRDNWKNNRKMSMIVSTKLPWEANI